MKSDVEIAREAKLRPITEIAAALGIDADTIEPYGRYKAKLTRESLAGAHGKQGKLILVTAINPTPAGEGKTTTSVGLADALHRQGKKTIVALREPSLGPCFGMKGGAAGGGRSGNGGAVRGGRVHPRHGRGNSRSAGGGPAGPQRRMALTWGEC